MLLSVFLALERLRKLYVHNNNRQNTVMIQIIGTDIPGHIVQTKIRLLQRTQDRLFLSDLGLHYHAHSNIMKHYWLTTYYPVRILEQLQLEKVYDQTGQRRHNHMLITVNILCFQGKQSLTTKIYVISEVLQGPFQCGKKQLTCTISVICFKKLSLVFEMKPFSRTFWKTMCNQFS